MPRRGSATRSRPTTSRPPARSSPDSPAGRVPDRARRRAEGLQLLRRAARQPRGDDARHVRERAPAERARARLGGNVDGARPVRRGADDLRRLDAATSKRARRRSSSPARSTAPARRATGPRRGRTSSACKAVIAESLRADPPLEPPDDGRAAAAVHGRRDAGVARPDRPRVVLDHRRRERRGPRGDRPRRRDRVPRARQARHAAASATTCATAASSRTSCAACSRGRRISHELFRRESRDENLNGALDFVPL